MFTNTGDHPTTTCGCGVQFRDAHGLFYHQLAASHFQDRFCVICDKTFSRNDSFNRHIREVHEQRKVCQCWLCEKQYGRPDSLKVHFENVHQLFLCVRCNALFNQKSELTEHISSAHIGNWRFTLEDCTFHNVSTLKSPLIIFVMNFTRKTYDWKCMSVIGRYGWGVE